VVDPMDGDTCWGVHPDAPPPYKFLGRVLLSRVIRETRETRYLVCNRPVLYGMDGTEESDYIERLAWHKTRREDKAEAEEKKRKRDAEQKVLEELAAQKKAEEEAAVTAKKLADEAEELSKAVKAEEERVLKEQRFMASVRDSVGATIEGKSGIDERSVFELAVQLSGKKEKKVEIKVPPDSSPLDVLAIRSVNRAAMSQRNFKVRGRKSDPPDSPFWVKVAVLAGVVWTVHTLVWAEHQRLLDELDDE